MSAEIKRRTELVICSLLQEALPGFKFYPAKGGGDESPADTPKPPFGIVTVDNSEKRIATEGTWQFGGMVVWVTRQDGTSESDHAEMVNSIYKSLAAIGSGYDVKRKLFINGLDVGTTDDFTDAKRQANGDTIGFSVGVTEGC